MLEYLKMLELKNLRFYHDVSNIARVTYRSGFDGDWSMLGIAARRIYSDAHIYRAAINKAVTFVVQMRS